MTSLDSTIWWHVYPLGATGAPIRDRHEHPDDGAGRRLHRLEPWLDHVVDLGCDGILLGPLFASAQHGYDTLDHFALDPRLGDDAEWDHFVREARRRGLRIMLDGVFNHVGIDHPLVARTLEAGHGPVRTTERDGHRIPQAWEGHGDLAELDHHDPEVVELVTEVMLHWLRRGADGWRLDVAYAVPPQFWATVLPRVREEFPDAFFLGEVIHGDYPQIARAGTLDTVTQYELWKATWSALHDRNMWELAWALQRHDEFSAQSLMQTFVGNHDVTRIATRVGTHGAAAAAVLLLTLPGMPSIYYGDELGWHGEKGSSWAADAPLRPELPRSPWEAFGDLDDEGQQLFGLHQRLVALRRAHPWLTRGRVEVLDRTNETIRYAVSGEGRTLQVDLTVDGEATLHLDGQQLLAWRAPVAA